MERHNANRFGALGARSVCSGELSSRARWGARAEKRRPVHPPHGFEDVRIALVNLALRGVHVGVARQNVKGILIAFLAHCLTAALKHWLQMHAPGLGPQAGLEKLAASRALDVWLPTTPRLFGAPVTITPEPKMWCRP